MMIVRGPQYGKHRLSVEARHDAHRVDLVHYWARLMWYRDELWRITTPVWTVYGAFLASIVGYVWSAGENGTHISAQVALMLLFGILTFSWVIFRVYWIYASCIYDGIEKLNREIQKKEVHIYDTMLNKSGWSVDYGCFRVRPKLYGLFTIIGVTMMMACMFTVAASVKFNFYFCSVDPSSTDSCGQSAEPSLIAMHWVFYIGLLLICIFEWYMHKEETVEKCPDCKESDEKISERNKAKCTCKRERPQLKVLFAIVGIVMILSGVFIIPESIGYDFWSLHTAPLNKLFSVKNAHWIALLIIVICGIVERCSRNRKKLGSSKK